MKERAKPGRLRLFVWGKRALRCCDAAAGEYIFHHPLPGMVTLLLRKMERKPDWLSDFPVQIYCNREVGFLIRNMDELMTAATSEKNIRWL